jgi:hypothetical protein
MEQPTARDFSLLLQAFLQGGLPMKTVPLNSIEIQICDTSPAPVMTAAHLLADWLRQAGGVCAPVVAPAEGQAGVFRILIGVLDQPPVRQWVEQHNLPTQIRSDGYVLAVRGETLAVYSRAPRGVVYACGYEVPRRATVQGEALNLDADLAVVEPADDLRGWIFWGGDHSFLPHAAAKYRLNMIWLSNWVNGEALLPAEPALQPYLAPHADEIRTNRAATAQGVALAKAHGVEVYLGSLGAVWHLPGYLYEGITHVYPEMLARGYKGGSDWPPYEWQDRPQLCPTSPVTRRVYTAAWEELLAAHPDIDGIATGLGYDGYPLGCGCECCGQYSYNDRFRDQIMLLYDVVVRKHHKKLWLWTWVTGGSAGVPGYDNYYAWVKPFAEAHPESVIVSSFAVEGDFNITHRLNPVVGTRGPNDMGNVLFWPEYRGDSAVFGCIIDWMARAFPALRAQGARGFSAVDTRPHNHERDIFQGAAELYALGELTWNADKSAEAVAAEYYARTFGPEAGPLVAGLVRKSLAVIIQTHFLPDGIRFSGHSHIEHDLRMMWEIYTLSDSAPFFLTAEQRRQIMQAGRPYEPQIEAALPGLAITEANLAAILRAKDEAVAGGEWMQAQAELARPYLAPELYEQLRTRCHWQTQYARFFRGYARAFFRLRLGHPTDGAEVLAGTEEMEAAVSVLPQTPPPLPYGLDPQFGGGYPWMNTPPQELINSLKAAGELLAHDITARPIGVWGSEETAAALTSIYLPYERVELESDLARYGVVVVGPSVMQALPRRGGDKLAEYIQRGGRALFYNPTDNWEALPAAWLPGEVLNWVCNHPSVFVVRPTHPVVRGYRDLAARPITRFGTTSAGVSEAMRFAPFIKSFVTTSPAWTTLTYPAVLAETAWGQGRLFINLLPENRTILLRALAHLTRPEAAG